MKKIISLLAMVIFLSISLNVNAEASVVRGKRYYVKLLKDPCGFKGDVMGKHHTKKEWRDAYRKGTLGLVIKEICPKAPTSISKKKLKHLYHFLSSFASDSGNVPSCN
jgi:hypothetical protein